MCTFCLKNFHILRLTTPTSYGMTILQALLNKYEAEESGIIDYSKNSEGSYYSNGSLVQDMSATSNGFYFTQVVEDEDNNKIHMTEDDKTVYFFRGVAEQNYIEFANYCWRIFRSNENEGARLVLYGNYSEGSGCTLNKSILPQAAYNLTSNNNAYIGFRNAPKTFYSLFRIIRRKKQNSTMYSD